MCFTFHLSTQSDGNHSHSSYWSCREPWKYRLELSLAVQRERSDEEEEVAPLSALLHEQGLFTAGMLNPFIFTYGESYLISAFQEEVLSLPPPYETMCSKYDSKTGEYSYADGVVQSEECSSKCIADNWQQHCSCFSKLYSVKHRRKGPICEYIDHHATLCCTVGDLCGSSAAGCRGASGGHSVVDRGLPDFPFPTSVFGVLETCVWCAADDGSV
ncbi:hypothetical protein HPB50_022627 [Hyalomma asiaticum]|uniref:Uncharacterized protein n=1 Tax=Hyalomma asiaticum TaxID=266040 RepID=A0ACB7SHT1_HYAAI|nr:hypothetical protein HPB50_022627 [Hyalomma asiaticum]